MKWRQRHNGDSIRHIVGGRRQDEFVASPPPLFLSFSPPPQIAIHEYRIRIPVLSTRIHGLVICFSLLSKV
jgi:hypothetical protein